MSIRRNKRMVLKNLQHYFHNILLLSLKISFVVSSFINVNHHHVQAHVFIYAGCSQQKYQPNSPYENNLNSLLTSITSSASQSSYNSFAIGNGTTTSDASYGLFFFWKASGVFRIPEPYIKNDERVYTVHSECERASYGLYQCRGDLRTTDCAQCIQNAVGQIGLVCPYNYGARLQLEGCLVRYENQDFLGKLDTSDVYKKCSLSSSNDVEFFKRRDDVLADLQAANGFRVSSLGSVEGFAQCLGDLDQGQCSSCLAEAVGKLKNVCGSAPAADVYLVQCYARYSASGYYDSTTDSSEDQIGKMVAIIVGVLAGIALIVVLLSLMRKAAG